MGATCQGTYHVIRGLEISVLAPNFQEGERGWTLSSITNDSINHIYVMKLHKSPKGLAWRAFWLVNTWRCWGSDLV